MDEQPFLIFHAWLCMRFLMLDLVGFTTIRLLLSVFSFVHVCACRSYTFDIWCMHFISHHLLSKCLDAFSRLNQTVIGFKYFYELVQKKESLMHSHHKNELKFVISFTSLCSLPSLFFLISIRTSFCGMTNMFWLTECLINMQHQIGASDLVCSSTDQ